MQPAAKPIDRHVQSYASGSGKSHRSHDVKAQPKQQLPVAVSTNFTPQLPPQLPLQEKWNTIYEVTYNKLRELGIIDAQCVLTEGFKHLNLPSIKDKAKHLNSFFTSTIITVKYRPTPDGEVHKAEIPLVKFLNEFVIKGRIDPQFHVENIEVIGGKVANLLGWSFFEASLIKLLNHYKNLTGNTVPFSDIVPNELITAMKLELEAFCSDIDLRIYMPLLKPLGREELRTKVIEFITANTPGLQSTHIALEYGFENIARVGDEQNPGLLVSVSDRNGDSELQYDILFHSGMSRGSLARRDALRVVGYDSNYPGGWLQNAYLNSEIENGWGFVLSRLTRKLDIPAIENCNYKAYGPVQCLSIKGYDIVTANALKILIQKAHSVFTNKPGEGNQVFKDKGLYFYEDIWLENLTHHLHSNPYDGLLLLIEFYENLKSLLSPMEMGLFLTNSWNHLVQLAPKIEQDKLDCTLLNTIFRLITKENSNFINVYNQLKLFIFLEITKPRRMPGEINWKPAGGATVDYYFHGLSIARTHKVNLPLNFEIIPKLDDSLEALQKPVSFDRVINEMQRTHLKPIEVGGAAISKGIEGLLKTGEKKNIKLATSMIIALDMTKPPLNFHLLVIQYYTLIMSNLDTKEEKENFHDYFEDALERSIFKPLRTTLGKMRGPSTDPHISLDDLNAEWIKNLIASRSMHVNEAILKLCDKLSPEKLKIVLEISIPVLLTYAPSCAAKLWNKYKQVFPNNIYQKIVTDIYLLKQTENSKVWESDLEKDFPKNEDQLFNEISSHTDGFTLNDVGAFLDRKLSEVAAKALRDIIEKNSSSITFSEVKHVIETIPKDSFERLLNTSETCKINLVKLMAAEKAFEKDEKTLKFFTNILGSVVDGPQSPELLKLFADLLFKGRFCQNYAHLPITRGMLKQFSGLLIENLECASQYSLEFKQGIRRNLTRALELLSDSGDSIAVLNLFFGACSTAIAAQYKDEDIKLLMGSLEKSLDDPNLSYYEEYLYLHRNIVDAYESYKPMLIKVVLQLLETGTTVHDVDWLNYIKVNDKVLDPANKFSEQNGLYSIARQSQKSLSLKNNILKHLHSKNYPFQIQLLKQFLLNVDTLIKSQEFLEVINLLQSLNESLEAYPEIARDYHIILSKLIDGLSLEDSKTDLLIKSFEVLPIPDANLWRKLLKNNKIYDKFEYLERLVPLVLKFENSKIYGEDQEFRILPWKQLITKLVIGKSVKLLDIIPTLIAMHTELKLTEDDCRLILSQSIQILQAHPKLVKDNIGCVVEWYVHIVKCKYLNFQAYSTKDFDRDIELIKLLNGVNSDSTRVNALIIISYICLAKPAIPFNANNLKCFRKTFAGFQASLEDDHKNLLLGFLYNIFKSEIHEDLSLFLVSCVKHIKDESIQNVIANILKKCCQNKVIERSPAQLNALVEAMTDCISDNILATSIASNGFTYLDSYKKIGEVQGKKLYKLFRTAYVKYSNERKESIDTCKYYLKFLVNNLYSSFNDEPIEEEHKLILMLLAALIRVYHNFDSFIQELDNVLGYFCIANGMDLNNGSETKLNNGKLLILQKIAAPRHSVQELTAETRADFETYVMSNQIVPYENAFYKSSGFILNLIAYVFKLNKSSDQVLEAKFMDFSFANVEFLIDNFTHADKHLRTAIFNFVRATIPSVGGHFRTKLGALLTKAYAKGIYKDCFEDLFEHAVYLEIPEFYNVCESSSIRAERVASVLAHFVQLAGNVSSEIAQHSIIAKAYRIFATHNSLSLKENPDIRIKCFAFLITTVSSNVGVKIQEDYIFNKITDLLMHPELFQNLHSYDESKECHSINSFYYIEMMIKGIKACNNKIVHLALLDNLLFFMNFLNDHKLLSTKTYEKVYLKALDELRPIVILSSKFNYDYIDSYIKLFCNNNLSFKEWYHYRAETSECFIKELVDSKCKNIAKKVFEYFTTNYVFLMSEDIYIRISVFLKSKGINV